ncbi:S-formylglutathione hydrolase FrmB [Paenibacillus uliginis N3/975]|uniref:S-formylglutathione hydrolase FrmB n=1 Tax=Paenibacillus uliginis N3/975 TaxID=1313296 RepID=A0A1X7G9W1_9BACL|nr:alpha/beta hydrolase family protein [Paenibacillus uliginis]SMF66496.1 S-formylglutathione hydrolase FrmB [Paenibacillus uliginis N3/975]
MAWITCDFFAETLGLSTSIHVFLPQSGLDPSSHSSKLPVLYLLHGRGADHTEWMRNSSIERYAESKGIALVMPGVGRSYYMDMANGLPYFTFLSEELPQLVKSFFPISDRREDTYVAGISMGGYGAFKLAMSYPERFAAGASLSGGLDLASRAAGPAFQESEIRALFGNVDRLKGSRNDLLFLAEKFAAHEGNKPRLYQCCGTEDFLYQDNQTFRQYAENLGIEVTYEEEPGEHEWGYWDYKIQRVLDWLPLP